MNMWYYELPNAYMFKAFSKMTLLSPWGNVWANTKSEARAAIKRENGIKTRLPIGTLVRKVGPVA